MLGRCQDCLDLRLRELRPYVLAALVSYCTGLKSLSRSSRVITYALLGIPAAHIELSRPLSQSRCKEIYEVQPRMLAGASLFFLAGLFLLTRSLVLYS